MGRRMNWSDGFIAVDWGTTNRRAYKLDAAGSCSEEFSDGKGILSVPEGGFEAAVSEIRENLGELPLLLAGMIGSNRGWVEAPYVGCPAGPEELANALVPAPGGWALIVPGVAYRSGRCDVMRGEEVQILGAAAAGEIPRDCLICHPGTHNKWTELQAGRIVSIRTVMTGELFSLLKAKSILSDLMQGESNPGPAFADGVERTLSGAGLTSELFGARASVLLGGAKAEDMPSFISGLLIGEDVRVGLADAAARDRPVVVMGRDDLTRLYAAALSQAGVESSAVSGERAFIAGAAKIVELVR
jgi:2-dehydro-3-deoxygalactonokinase